MTEFKDPGKKPGMEVWRIEKMVPTPVPPKMYGQFYEGDAYICLKTTQKPNSSTLNWDIFFWLGKECSQDEAGVAAYKTVELDEALGGGPTQHRECQGHESDLFMQCFKSVQYHKGGVASGFTHVVRDQYETRLLHLKGAKMVRVNVVPLSASSLNAGDVFVLDMGLKIIQWNGSEANRKEKAKALDVCDDIKCDERGGKATIIACEQGSEPDEFWEALGGRGAVAPATDDNTTAKLAKGELKLIKVSDSSGSIVKTEVATGTLEKKMLTSDDVFIMDNVAEIYVWVGKKASPEERKKGMEIGQAYCTESARPAGTKIAKVMEGTEPTMFKANFSTWPEEDEVTTQDFMASPRGNVAQATKERSLSQQAMGMIGSIGNSIKRMSLSRNVNADGESEVWRIEGFEKVLVDDSLEGQFYAGDSYIIKYTYEKDGKPNYIIYFWQGLQSSQDEKGAAAILASDMDKELGGAATQVRVVMGKEPSHFVRIFKGKMVIHSGGKASGFKNKADADAYDTDGTSLFHIRGTDEFNTRAVQVGEEAENLNSGDSFVLLTPSTMYIWYGTGCSDSEKATAKTTSALLKKPAQETVELQEGSEPEAFWTALGGKTEYPSAKWLPPAAREAMLFNVSNSTGSIKIEPIFNFSQADLEEEDVYILDVYTTIFVWVGDQANDKEKEAAEGTAHAYIKAQKMDADTPVIAVKSGAEPEMFQANFLGWDESKKKVFVDPYEAKLAALKASNPEPEKPTPAAPVPPPSAPSGSIPTDGSYTLNYEELKKPAEQLPKGLDLTKKEQYLSDDEFLKVLGSPRGEFNSMKAWKQNQIKKAAGLF